MLGLRVCTRGERWWGQSCKGALQECMCRRKQERKPGMCESRAGRNMGESQKNNVRVCEKERESVCVCYPKASGPRSPRGRQINLAAPPQ